MTTYNEFGGYGHPDHIRTHDVAVRAFERAGDPAWYPEQLEAGLAPWAPSKLYNQAIPRSVRETMNARWSRRAGSRCGRRPRTRHPSRSPRWRSSRPRCSSRTSSITTWVDVSGAPLEAKWAAIHEHVTQISDESPFMLLGSTAGATGWGNEAYILRESRVESAIPETDLFAGIV